MKRAGVAAVVVEPLLNQAAPTVAVLQTSGTACRIQEAVSPDRCAVTYCARGELGDLMLRKQTDLQIELRALVGSGTHPVLRNQYEGGKENGLD
jgi:hypothetical protein